MLERKKIKVILAQLNDPYMECNIPLAAGYLKAMAFSMGLFNIASIEILNKIFSNYAGDFNLISYIVSKQPDAIGFSCYVWNIDRTIYIIDQIKSKLPKVKIICGGTEVSCDYRKIMKNRNIDIIVIGEGELTFIELLKYFVFKRPRLEEINGIVFRQGKKIIVTRRREQIPDINIIPSPYLLGFIDPKQYGELIIETYRGCIEKCTYCNWRRNFHGVRYFSIKRIRNELKLAKEKGVKSCRIIDTNFNLPSNLSRICKVIKEINNDKYLSFSVEGRAEFINKKTVKLLSQCNITYIVIGLQSLNQTALNKVNRWFDKTLFIRGLGLLKKAKISFRLDIIIGLPGDTKDSIMRSIKFVDKVNKGKNYLSILRVQPDTELKEQAKLSGLRYLHRHPYFIVSTNELPYHELKKIWSYCNKIQNVLPLSWSLNKFLFSPHEDYKEIPKGAMKTCGVNHTFATLCIEIDNSQSIEKINNLISKLSRFVNLNSNIFLKCINLEYNYLFIKKLIHEISKINPSSRLTFIIEDNSQLDTKIIHNLRYAIIHKTNDYEYRIKFFCRLLDMENLLEKTQISILKSLSEKVLRDTGKKQKGAQIIRRVLLSGDLGWENLLVKSLNVTDGDLLIELGTNLNKPYFIAKILNCVYRHKQKNKSIFFSDYAMQLFYNEILVNRKTLLYCVKNINYILPSNLYRFIYFDKHLNINLKKYNITNCLLRFIQIADAYNSNFL